jgi:hypothetical protein
MPRVVPTPRSQTCPAVIVSGVRSPGPEAAMKTNPVTITTRLLRTGAQAGGPKTSRELRIAWASAPIP